MLPPLTNIPFFPAVDQKTSLSTLNPAINLQE